jgi:hypothetical protein
MVVNVWNLRFLKGQSTQPGPALVTADLKVVTSTQDGKTRLRLVGTITNTSERPLKNIAVRTQAGWAQPLARSDGTAASAPIRIGPSETVTIDAAIDTTPPPVSTRDPNDRQAIRYPYYGGNVVKIDPARLWDQGGDLSMRRTERIDQWISECDDLACVCAELDTPDPAAGLKDRQPIQSHWKVVRALVPLGK